MAEFSTLFNEPDLNRLYSYYSRSRMRSPRGESLAHSWMISKSKRTAETCVPNRRFLSAFFVVLEFLQQFFPSRAGRPIWKRASGDPTRLDSGAITSKPERKVFEKRFRSDKRNR